MFRLAVFRHGPRAKRLDSLVARVPNSGNVMNWSGGRLLLLPCSRLLTGRSERAQEW